MNLGGFIWIHEKEAYMSILAEDQIEVRAERRALLRSENVSSRVTKKEAEQIDALASQRGLQRGDCIRQVLLAELARSAQPSVASPELVEIIGLRMILTNLLRSISQAQPITQERFDAIMTEVRRSKLQVANDMVAKIEGGR